MPGQIDLTLKELAQIALGTPKMTKVNLTILHSLIDLILKKLNCADEKVSIGGYESICLQRILAESKISPLPLNDERIEMISQKLDRLMELEERINNVDGKLERHFEQMRRFNDMEDHTLTFENWDEYQRTCEDICTLCDPDNEIACSLLQNPSFMKKLTRRVATPMVDRIFEFERKIEELNNEFHNFLGRAEEEYAKIALIDGCLQHVEELRTRMGEHELKFIGTMEEVQDMLDAKMDKIHLAPLKQYIRDRFDEIGVRLNVVSQQKNCPRASAVIMNMKCMSCGFEKACVDESGVALPLMPDASVKKRAKLKKFCACGNQWVPKNERTNINQRYVQMNLPIDDEPKQEQPKKCKDDRNSLQLMMGFDGNFYRTG